MNLNQRTVTIKITRTEILDLMLLCAGIGDGKWAKFHDKLREQVIKADIEFAKEKLQ